MEDLYPIAVLIDELKHDDVLLRLNAIHRLSTIALALGPDRSRDELIPFLNESIDDEDEVLVALAEELGNFVPYIGGSTYAHLLLVPLETLAAVEETVVREKAVESAAKIGAVLSTLQIEEVYIPMVNRLTKGDWFTSRTSACGLYAPIYDLASPKIQDDLRMYFSLICSAFATLCRDETPMVRRAAATQFAKFVKKVSKTHIIADLLPLLNALAGDEQDSVRLLTVDDLIAISQILTPEENKTLLLNTLRNLCADKSWRVRYMIAEKFVSLCTAIGPELTKEEMISVYSHVLKDNEAEVRSAACTQISGFSGRIDKDAVLKEIIPCIRDIVVDASQHVRSSLALHISGLAPILGKEMYFLVIFRTIDSILPLFLQLLKDEASEVRLNIISKLDVVNEVIGIELLSQSLLPAIVELAEDKQWRVRLAIIENIPLLAGQLGVDFFNEKLGPLCISWLGDCVFAIREAATHNLQKLTDVFGYSWAKQVIIPKILAMGQHSNYLYRLTTIMAITTISFSVTGDVLKDTMVPAIVKLAHDPIPNIRFNVAKSLEELVPLVKKNNLGALLSDVVKPSLVKLMDDSDADVKYYAQKALQAVTSTA